MKYLNLLLLFFFLLTSSPNQIGHSSVVRALHNAGGRHARDSDIQVKIFPTQCAGDDRVNSVLEIWTEDVYLNLKLR